MKSVLLGVGMACVGALLAVVTAPGSTVAVLWRLLRALVFALWAHHGQKDKAGKPYWHHLVSVAWLAYGLTHDPEAVVVGLLHDYIEDVNPHGWLVIDRKFGGLTGDRVVKLSRVPSETDLAYDWRVEHGDAIVVAVKTGDLLHNTMPGRLPPAADDEHKQRNTDRLVVYQRKLERLTAVRSLAFYLRGDAWR